MPATEGLDLLVKRFLQAGRLTVCGEAIGIRVRNLIDSAIDGTLAHGEIGEVYTLHQAVVDAQPELPRLRDAYIESQRGCPNFKFDLFAADLTAAVDSLRTMNIGKWPIRNFANINILLSDTNSIDPNHKVSAGCRKGLRILKSFFRLLMALDFEMKLKTGYSLPDVSSCLDKYDPFFHISYADQAPVPWRDRGVKTDFNTLCPIDVGGFKMGARMAYMLDLSCAIISDSAHDKDNFASLPGWRVPEFLKPFWADNSWRQQYRYCFHRLHARICKGRAPAPNCTGEELALYVAVDHAIKDDGFVNESEFEKLKEDNIDETDGEESESDEVAVDEEGFPTTKRWEMFLECATEDQDVIEMFPGGVLHDTDGGTKRFERAISQDSFENYAFLHPQLWFVAFEPKRIRDHWTPPVPKLAKRKRKFQSLNVTISRSNFRKRSSTKRYIQRPSLSG
eukprot:TRINITY_DN68891_c0_g1_i1.p1 TRINITY_DN68891_c0_g1~~TRINITY_DN68891_c0_g1_i1.p1  ORF type:complete len:451 (-),score=51.67 TRINITY_DN68891_c0_g1_i1:10-1362(-)